MKTAARIPFTEIGSIPQLIKDFLEQKIPEFRGMVFSKENFNQKIQEKNKSFTAEQREILVKVLKSQYSSIQLNEKQSDYLELLSKENTFTVTTGHQLNLFTGPVFFIYKILQTIKTAAWLKSEFPEQNFVPVFWMATEDHDFEEIDHFRTRDHFYQMKAPCGGAVGRIVIEDISFIKDFEDEIKDTVFGTELLRRMQECYIPGRTLAEATRILVNGLFADHGLLIIDGDEPALKGEMQDIFAKEISGNLLHHSTQNTVDFIKENYGKVQVNPRELNLFYLNKNRERIDPHGENFILDPSGTAISREMLLIKLKENPENFSPNALLRPVFQETVLPNIAYIGGNAEVMYWLELVDFFKEIGLPFPVLIPRNSMLFLTGKTFGKIEKTGLKVQDFFKNFPEVISRILVDKHVLLDEINNREKSVAAAFEALKNKAAETDPTFGNLVQAEEKRQLKSFDKMKKRLLRAEKIKQHEKVTQLENLFLEVHPGKTWQERVWNFSVFYRDEGAAWLQTCYDAMDVEKSELIVMEI